MGRVCRCGCEPGLTRDPSMLHCVLYYVIFQFWFWFFFWVGCISTGLDESQSRSGRESEPESQSLWSPVSTSRSPSISIWWTSEDRTAIHGSPYRRGQACRMPMSKCPRLAWAKHGTSLSATCTGVMQGVGGHLTDRRSMRLVSKKQDTRIKRQAFAIQNQEVVSESRGEN